MAYNPSNDDLEEGVPADITRTLRRRKYLIEKARNANIIGKPSGRALCLHARDSLPPSDCLPAGIASGRQLALFGNCSGGLRMSEGDIYPCWL